MSNKKFDDYSNEVNYVLETYSSYIDNLQIVELKNLLSNNTNYDKYAVRKIINIIMQLIVDECGSDIVNDLDLPSQGYWGYYKDVIFNDHVNIRKDNINDNEFTMAKFNDGVTVHSKKLPNGALSAVFMNGDVDLTNVIELKEFNLNYINERNYAGTVKLSKDLKKINCFSLDNKLLNSVIEYPGTVQEFNDMVFENFLSWSRFYKIKFDTVVLGEANTLKIKCLDGDWDHEVFRHDQRYHEWAN